MNKVNYIALFTAMMVVFLTGCEEKANDWEVQPGYAALFKPLVFELSTAKATSAEIKYNRVIDADKYIFEFSEDSLLFNAIVRKVEVLADTLTPFAKSSTATKTEYRTLFEDLDASSKYSVRMQAVNTVSGLVTKYSTFYFETLSEQIITDAVAYTDKVEVAWTQTDRVTKLVVENPLTGEVVATHDLTADEIANAKAVIESLNSGTTFTVKIYNDTKMRGSKAFKTLGLANSVVVNLAPSDTVANVLAASVAAGNTSITLALTGGLTYDWGTLTVPTGVSNLSITGIADENGQLPMVNLPQFRLTDLIVGKIIFENIQMKGVMTQHCVYLSVAGTEVESVSFLGCTLDSFNSVIRAANSTIKIGSIMFDNCRVNSIGGYGVVNVGGSTPTVGSVTFQNSTLTELTTQLMDVRTKVAQIDIKSCTFCNLKSAMAQLLRFDANNLPQAVNTDKLIVAGTNNGAKINSLSFDASSTSLSVSFVSSYRTNDLTINKYEFSGINIFAGTAYDLFVDPDNKNFSVKPSSGFAGRGTAGDPRWF